MLVCLYSFALIFWGLVPHACGMRLLKLHKLIRKALSGPEVRLQERSTDIDPCTQAGS